VSDQELREINLKVASAIAEARGGKLSETSPYWAGVVKTIWTPIPSFTTVASGAEMVRIEIERRGWFLNRLDYISTRPLPAYPSQHRAVIIRNRVEGDTMSGEIEHCGTCDDSPHVALCLAFLAAVEAEGKVSP
jgi:hypothetical protein